MKRNLLMLVLILSSLSLSLFPLSVNASTLPSCQWPAYENDVRVWGEVFTAYSSGHLIILTYAANPNNRVYVHIDCSADPACFQLQAGDSLLVRGHLEDTISCTFDNIDDYVVSNVMWKCIENIGGTCAQLTQCQ